MCRISMSKIGLVCVQFYKTKTPQIKKSHPIQELSKEVDKFSNSVKKSLKKEPKMKKLLRKKFDKIARNWQKKIEKYGPQKHCGIDFRWLHIHSASIKIYFYKKSS